MGGSSTGRSTALNSHHAPRPEALPTNRQPPLITFSCHHRLPYLLSPNSKDTVEQVLEHTRQTHTFDLHAYVLMPEHVHLLLSEPLRHNLATTLHVLKQESAKLLLGSRDRLCLPRHYDHNVRTEAKRLEKIRYIHRNPVKRGLTTKPEDYPWSSALHYATGTTTTTIDLTSYWTTPATPKAGDPFMAALPP